MLYGNWQQGRLSYELIKTESKKQQARKKAENIHAVNSVSCFAILSVSLMI